MGQAAQQLRMTEEEYLAFERTSEERHEFADGEIFAMSGGTYEHARAALNITRELDVALLDKPCVVVGSDMKLKVVATGRYQYPDVVVVCGPLQFEGDKHEVVLNPKVIVEVLSDSTEAYDRGDKFAGYQTIGSFEEYVLVSQKTVRVEHFRRLPDGTWSYRALGSGERLALPSLGCEIEIDRVYLKVFPVG